MYTNSPAQWKNFRGWSDALNYSHYYGNVGQRLVGWRGPTVTASQFYLPTRYPLPTYPLPSPSPLTSPPSPLRSLQPTLFPSSALFLPIIQSLPLFPSQQEWIRLQKVGYFSTSKRKEASWCSDNMLHLNGLKGVADTVRDLSTRLARFRIQVQRDLANT